MRLVASCALSLALAGCADPAIQYQKELTDEQTPSTATVVVARFFVGDKYAKEALIDGKDRCVLEDQTYCIVQVPPGIHYFAMDLAKNQDRKRKDYVPPRRISVPLEVIAGKTNFVRIDSKVNSVIPIVIPGYFIGIYGDIDTYILPMTKEEFLKMRPRIERVKPITSQGVSGR